MENKSGIKFSVRDMRHKAKFFVDDLYLDDYAKKCGVYATGVYSSLCRHVDVEQKCYPSYKKIAEELHISTRQVGRCIKILEKYNIIETQRIGKKLNNRYLLLDRSEWADSSVKKVCQSNQIGTASPVHSKETQLRIQNNKEDFLYKDLSEAYKRGDRSRKPFYKKREMRWVAARGKWYVIDYIRNKNGDWLDFTASEKEIEWR